MKSGIKDCAKAYASKRGCSLKEAELAMRTAIEVIKDEIVNTGGVSFLGLFSLTTVERNERRGINPATGEYHTIPAYKTVKISVGKALKEELNK